MITDGEPTDMKRGDQKWTLIKETIENCEKNGKFQFFMVGIEPANIELLNDLLPCRRSTIKLSRAMTYRRCSSSLVIT